MPLHDQLELTAGVHRVRQLLEASARFVEGGRAPLGIGVEDVDLDQLPGRLVVSLLGEEALSDLELRAGGGRALVLVDIVNANFKFGLVRVSNYF